MAHYNLLRTDKTFCTKAIELTQKRTFSKRNRNIALIKNYSEGVEMPKLSLMFDISHPRVRMILMDAASIVRQFIKTNGC